MDDPAISGASGMPPPLSLLPPGISGIGKSAKGSDPPEPPGISGMGRSPNGDASPLTSTAAHFFAGLAADLGAAFAGAKLRIPCNALARAANEADLVPGLLVEASVAAVGEASEVVDRVE